MPTDIAIGTLPIVAAFIAAGFIWTLGGFVSNLRKHLAFVQSNPAGTKDPNWSGFDRQALKDDLLLGSGLGIIAFFVNAATGSPIEINSLGSFALATWGAVSGVAVVDKYIVSGLFGK